jgi:hypothetical protein
VNASGHEDVATALSSSTPASPEDRLIFRLAQLTLLLETAEEQNVKIGTVDRLGYYDFFSANPFVVVQGEEERDRADRLRLRLAGFSENQLSYASVGQRFVSRRRRIQHDLALLLGYGIVAITEDGYRLTEPGKGIAHNLTSVYADQYREAVAVVLRRLSRLSDKRLTENARRWLGREWLLIDLLDDVRETVPDAQRRTPTGRRRAH